MALRSTIIVEVNLIKSFCAQKCIDKLELERIIQFPVLIRTHVPLLLLLSIEKKKMSTTRRCYTSPNCVKDRHVFGGRAWFNSCINSIRGQFLPGRDFDPGFCTRPRALITSTSSWPFFSIIPIWISPVKQRKMVLRYEGVVFCWEQWISMLNMKLCVWKAKVS